jgi:GntP family gluconate:H+ symporter
MVVPTPGPLAVAGNMSLDIGFFLLYAIVASIPAALVGGWLYGLWLGRSNPAIANLSIIGDEAAESTPGSSSESVPSGTLSILVLLVPVLLILFGSIFGVLLPEEMWITSLLRFLGDKNVALLIGVFFAFGTLRRHLKKPASVIVTESAAAAGLILLITGAGGAFGHVISTSGIGPYLVETMSQFNISLLILGFLLSAILRAAQGSATVALVTTSAILGPTVASVETSPILVGLAICAGGMCLSLPNDSGFWVVSRFANLSVRDTLKAWTVGGSLGGLVALAVVLILDSMRGVLPGI